MSRKRFLYPAVLILISILVVIVSSLLRPYDEDLTPTVENCDRFVYAAAKRFIEQKGYEAIMLDKSFASLSDGGLLIIAGPDVTAISEKEVPALIKWVEKGNSVIYLSSRGNSATGKRSYYYDRYSSELERYLGVTTSPSKKYKITASLSPIFATAFSKDVKELELKHWFTHEMNTREGILIPIFKEQSGDVNIYQANFGKGRLLYIPSTYLFSNEALRNEENAAFLINTLNSLTVDKRVIFDRYHHTFQEDSFELNPLQRRRIWYMILIFFTAFVMLIFSGYSRFGPIYSLEPVKTVSIRSYILSLGDLYRRSGKGPEIAEDMYALFLKKVCRRFGIKYSLNTEDMIKQMKLRSKEFHQLLLDIDEKMKKLNISFKNKELVEFEKMLSKAAITMGIN